MKPLEITAQFHYPTSLPNPAPKYNKLLETLHETIGYEQLSSRLEAISMQWAYESGYYFIPNGQTFTFIHVSLNPKDFGEEHVAI